MPPKRKKREERASKLALTVQTPLCFRQMTDDGREGGRRWRFRHSPFPDRLLISAFRFSFSPISVVVLARWAAKELGKEPQLAVRSEPERRF